MQVLDKEKYADNLIIEIKMLNDKLNGIKSISSPKLENEEVVNKYIHYFEPLVYLMYESAVIQLCWLFGKDNNNNEVHLEKHLESLSLNGDLERFAEIHLQAEIKLTSLDQYEQEKFKDGKIKEFEYKIQRNLEVIENLQPSLNKIQQARHNLFAHKQIMAFNNIGNAEIWEKFTPSLEELDESGRLAIKIALDILHIEKCSLEPLLYLSVLESWITKIKSLDHQIDETSEKK